MSFGIFVFRALFVVVVAAVANVGIPLSIVTIRCAVCANGPTNVAR